MATYSIKDLEKISGIKAHTLRVWESRYAILEPKRTETNIRYYEEDDLRLLLSISMLNSNGFKISKIAEMSREEVHQACLAMFENGEEFSHHINALSLSMIDLDETRFEKIIANSTLRYGFEETMIQVVHPFLERVGILWQTGTIRPAQEHFISNLIRQKLVVAIDAQQTTVQRDAKKYLLFLPENEFHENSLLFAAYLLRSRGNSVTYLGQNVPEDDLQSIYDTYRPDFFFTLMTISPQRESTEAFLRRLGTSFPQARILAAGYATEGVSKVPDNVAVLSQVKDLLQFA